MELNRAATELRAALASDKACDQSNTLLQRLESGTFALEDKTASKAENDLIKAYGHLVTTYQDGLLLCQYRTHSPQYQFIPKGRLYVFQELDPLVQKYALSTENHVYKPTGVCWKSIDKDAVSVIWVSMEVQYG